MSGRLRVAALVAVIAAAAGGWYAVAAGDESITWTEVTVEDLVVGIDVEGTLASRDSSKLTPPQLPDVYDFKIAFMAPEGQHVERDAPVLGFDTSTLEQQLLAQQNEAEAAAKNIEKLDADLRQRIMALQLRLAEAEAALRRAELRNDVPEDLRAENEARIAELDLRVARMEVESLKRQITSATESGASQRAALVAQRDRAQGRVHEIQSSIEQMTVSAPRAGTVIYITNWRDEKKKVGDSVWRREQIIELPDLTRMMAQGEVDEADAGRIAEGQAVQLRLDAHPDTVYTGTIESIWRTVQRKSGSRNPLKVVRLDIALEETDTARMRPGMRFQGRVEAERLEDVVTIPASAVFPSEGGPVVYRQGMLGRPEETAVVLGTRGEGRVQVLEGLSPGERIAETRPRA